MGSKLLYDYTLKKLKESGIDFSAVSKNDILATCGAYNGEISKESYNTVINAINDIYETKSRPS